MKIHEHLSSQSDDLKTFNGSASRIISSYIYNALMIKKGISHIHVRHRRVFEYVISITSADTGKNIIRKWNISIPSIKGIITGLTWDQPVEAEIHYRTNKLIGKFDDLDEIVEAISKHCHELDELYTRNITTKINNDNDIPRKILQMMAKKAQQLGLHINLDIQKTKHPNISISDRCGLSLRLSVIFVELEATVEIKFVIHGVSNYTISSQKINLYEPGVDPEKFMDLIDLLKGEAARYRTQVINNINGIDMLKIVKGEKRDT